MNIKFRIYKSLERGLWGKVLWFSIINVIVFGIIFLIYRKFNDTHYLGGWKTLRLFMSSSGILDQPEAWKVGSIILLIMECLGSVFFSGLIISLLTSLIMSKVADIKAGHVHYRLKNHIVVIGYDNIVPSILREIISSPDYKSSKIILETCENIEEIRCTLLSKLSKSDLRRIVIVHAPRQSIEELQYLRTAYAREVFIVGDRTQHDHDAENMQTFEALVGIHKKLDVKTVKPLMIWFENEASFAALQLNDISAEWKRYFEFRPYNFYKRWANRLLTNSNYTEYSQQIVYPELDHTGICIGSKKHVHLIIVGMNRMGTALARETAQLLHFPNFNDKTGENRTRITLIDDNADIEKDFFMGRLPGYFQIAPVLYTDLTQDTPHVANTTPNHFLDVQFEFIKGRIESPQVREWLREQLRDDNAIISIAICVDNPSQSFGMAMYLPEEVYTRGRDTLEKPWEVEDEDKIVNIFVRQETIGSLIKAFGNSARDEEAPNKRYANLYPFGMRDESFSLNNRSKYLALAFRYIYEFYFQHDYTLPTSIPSYEELSKQWKSTMNTTSLQWSNLYLADSIEFKLRSLGLNIETATSAILSNEEIEKLSYTEHNRWNMEKLLIGYRPATQEEQTLSDTAKKILKNKMFVHHLIKPYEELTEEEKDLDRNIIKKLPDILRMLNKDFINNN